MIVQKILAYCDVDGCLEAHNVEIPVGRPLTMREALERLRDADWAVSSPTQVRCPHHKHMRGRRGKPNQGR